MARGSLFDYGGRRGSDLHDVPLAVIDLETTGLSPTQHRVVEIAVARVENGLVVDEWSSLVDPGCDPGPTFIHRITAEHLESAPPIDAVIGAFLERLDGAVIVAHNASFEEGFLAAEFGRMRLRVPQLPALCTLALARQRLSTPNHRLETCCEHTGVKLHDAHTALGDVRATAALATALLVDGPGVRWTAGPAQVPRIAVSAVPRTRASGLRKGEAGWMASLLSKLPVATGATDDGAAVAYLAAAEAALDDGKLTGVEAKQLAGLAGSGGLGAAEVAALNRRVLDGLRDVALDDDVLTTTELADLNKAAGLLAEPDYFVDLVADLDDSPRRTRKPKGAAKGRLWLHPDLDPVYATRVPAAGFTLGKNITRTLVAVVVSPHEHGHPRVAKAIELGVDIVEPWALWRVLGEPSTPPQYTGPTPPTSGWTVEPDGTAESSAADPVAARGSGPIGSDTERSATPDHPRARQSPEPAWHRDPAQRHEYRWWDGTDWTEHVADRGIVTADPPIR